MNLKTIRVHEDVFNDISDYCKINGLKIVDFCSEKLKEAVLVEKYGDTPFGVMINKKQNDTMTKKIEEIENKEPIVVVPTVKPIEEIVDGPVVTEDKQIVRKRRL